MTARSWSIVTWQTPVPVQSPDHPEKTDDPSGVAVRSTIVPVWKGAVQVELQSIRAGELVMVPPAFVPAFDTASWWLSNETWTGHRLASVPDVIIKDPGGRPGIVILTSTNQKQYWLLD